MKCKKLAAIISCSILVASQLARGDVVRAQESFRVKRPVASDNTGATGYDAAPAANTSNDNSRNQYPKVLPAEVSVDSEQKAPLQATATMVLESPSIPNFRNAVYLWASQNNPELHSQSGTTDGAHHGLKSHLGGAFLAMASVAGGVAGSYIPIASVSGNRRLGEPLIKVDAGHCPAMVDPAFQIPVRWWDDLAREQADPVLGPQWKLWLDAVKEVFQAHARELKHTPGVASLHVIINPNGSIFNMSPYTGNERAHQDQPISEPTLMKLRDIVGTVGMFPPFPGGTRVRCYHLIFDGSAGGVF